MATNRISLPPRQMVPDSEKKTDKWKKDNIDAFENLILFENRQLKNSYFNKVTNYNLKRGILNEADVHSIMDPRGLALNTFPAKMQHMGIGNAKIDLLVGEHMKRKFDWRVSVSNLDGISRKEQEKIDKYRQFFIEQVKSESFDENEAQQKLQKLQDHLKYEWQDIAESGANKILRWVYQTQYMKESFDMTFEDALVSGEQYMIIEDLSNEIIVRKGDPLRIFTLLSADGTDERALDAFVEVSYHTISDIMDMFYDEFTQEQIDKLNTFRGMQTGMQNYENISYPSYGHIGELAVPLNSNTAAHLYTVNDIEKSYFATNFDVNGNIRRLHVIWRSKRKIQKIKIVDEYGLETFKYVHEKYKPSADRGEQFEKNVWVNEWWRGYKVGHDIYVKIEPVPYLSTSLENISKQSPPVILQLYNTNSSKTQSLMDIIKPYDYLYDIFSYRRELLVNKLKGDILQFNTSMIPDNMTLSEFMNYIETTGDMPLDPTAEIINGPQAGRAAGQVNNTVGGQIISSTQGGPLQSLTMIMNDVKLTLDTVSGITQQRQGAITSNELVGNVERSVTQSSHTTERWFARNDFFKKRVLKQVLDRQVGLFRKHPKKLAYILDDLTTVILTDEEMDAIMLSEFDLHIDNSSRTAELEGKIEMQFERALQAGTAKISDIIEFYNNESISSASRKLKIREEEQEQKAAQAQQQQSEIAQQQLVQQQELAQAELELEYAKLELKKYEIDKRAETELQKAAITSYIGQENLDQDNDGIPDPVELAKISLEQQKHLGDRMDKEADRSNKLELENKKMEQIKEQNKNQENLKRMDMKMKEKELEAKKTIERIKGRNKPKTK